MDARTFFFAVKQMREKQKEYFAEKDFYKKQKLLSECKQLETKIDAEIKRVLILKGLNTEPQQGTINF